MLFAVIITKWWSDATTLASCATLMTMMMMMQRALNAAASVVSGTRKFNHGLMQLLHADLHRPERVKYKLCMMMRRCQDATAPQYLTAHWVPVSETASRQHLRLAASH